MLGPNLTSILTFLDFLVPGRLTDFASTRSAIVVGNHVARTSSWIDIDGIPRELTSEGSVGELWTKSSGGPIRDGRLHGVDLTAPGQNLFASLAPRSYWVTFRFNQVQDGDGWYVRFGGTSGSAPIVVGAVGLMLQRRPDLTASQVREILRSGAVTDSFTGETPNANWGFGKLDVLAALDALSLN